jgi:hypothetical protein
MQPLSVSSRQNASDGSERPAARPVIDRQLIALLVKQGTNLLQSVIAPVRGWCCSAGPKQGTLVPPFY